MSHDEKMIWDNVVVGCGSSGAMQADGSWVITRYHGLACGHQESAESVEHVAAIGVLGDLTALVRQTRDLE